MQEPRGEAKRVALPPADAAGNGVRAVFEEVYVRFAPRLRHEHLPDTELARYATDPESMFLRGCIEYKAGEVDKAVQLFERVQEYGEAVKEVCGYKREKGGCSCQDKQRDGSGPGITDCVVANSTCYYHS